MAEGHADGSDKRGDRGFFAWFTRNTAFVSVILAVAGGCFTVLAAAHDFNRQQQREEELRRRSDLLTMDATATRIMDAAEKLTETLIIAKKYLQAQNGAPERAVISIPQSITATPIRLTNELGARLEFAATVSSDGWDALMANSSGQFRSDLAKTLYEFDGFRFAVAAVVAEKPSMIEKYAARSLSAQQSTAFEQLMDLLYKKGDYVRCLTAANHLAYAQESGDYRYAPAGMSPSAADPRECKL